MDDEYDTIYQHQTISKIPSILENSENVLENEHEKDCKTSDYSQPRAWRYNKSHPLDQVIGNVNEGVKTRSSMLNEVTFSAFIFEIEPSNVDEALSNNDRVIAMQEELHQFDRNQVWDLVPRPKDHSVIGTKWVFKNKSDESEIIVRNKARLVAKGYTQQEGINYEDIFSPVVHFNSIRLILAIVNSLDLELHQMDVKTAFLNGDLDEEIYMQQPLGFIKKRTENKFVNSIGPFMG